MTDLQSSSSIHYNYVCFLAFLLPSNRFWLFEMALTQFPLSKLVHQPIIFQMCSTEE
jgi:hypothetical protein